MSLHDPDAELLARVGAGEQGAVREIVARKLPRVLSLATRMLGERAEAEDVAQEAFLRIWNQAQVWQPGRARFDTWVHRVVLNLCYDRLRARGPDLDTSPDEVPEVVDQAPRPDERLDERARRDRVAAALARLPVRQREALVLHYYQELSNEEAAGLMGITIEALESLLARARRGMRGALGVQGNLQDTL